MSSSFDQALADALQDPEVVALARAAGTPLDPERIRQRIEAIAPTSYLAQRALKMYDMVQSLA